MKKLTGFLFGLCSLGFGLWAGVADAACSKQNFQRCLDSVCAINIGMNPAARCQLCGTASAGDAANKGLANVSVVSAKNTISAKELANAPKDPGEKYLWAIAECGKKVADCTADDTGDYDKLIEQSCRAAGVDAQLGAAAKKAVVKKTEDVCRNEISACIVDQKRCGRGYITCKTDVDFDRSFSSCAVEASGCDGFVAGIRTGLVSARDSAIKGEADLLASLVTDKKTARDARLKAAKDSCAGNASRQACVEQICADNMQNKCATGFANEATMANLLCRFHDTACGKLK